MQTVLSSKVSSFWWNVVPLSLLTVLYQALNQEAKQSAAGQTDLFSEGEVRSRDEILRDCATMFRIKGAKAQQKDPVRNGENQTRSLRNLIRKIYNYQNNINNKIA